MTVLYVVTTSNGEYYSVHGVFDKLDDAKADVIDLILHEYIDGEPNLEVWQGKERLKIVQHDKGKWSEQ